jgi:uncharacterized membrane protein YbhN (UPF0104 family)
MSEPAPKPRPPLWRYALAVLVSVGLLGALVAQVDVARAREVLATADPGWIGISTVLYLGLLVLRGFRLQLISEKTDATLAIAVNSVQTLLLRVTPLRAGELAMPLLLYRHAGEDPARSLVLLVLVRLLDLFLVCAAVLVGLFFRAGPVQGELEGPLVAVVVILGLLLATFRTWLSFGVAVARRAGDAVGATKIGLVHRVLDRLQAMLLGSAALTPLRRAVLGVTSACVLALQAVQIGAFLVAFDIWLPAYDLALGSCAAQLGSAIPIGAVGSFGMLEAGWTGGFVAVGVPMETAVVTGVAYGIQTLVTAAGLGAVSWLWLLRQPVVTPQT